MTQNAQTQAHLMEHLAESPPLSQKWCTEGTRAPLHANLEVMYKTKMAEALVIENSNSCICCIQ